MPFENTDRIQATTAGSLPRTPELIAANAARPVAADGFTLETTDEVRALTSAAVDDVVARQTALGITQPGDGEFGKAMSNSVDYGAWWGYSFQRVSGLSLTDENIFSQQPVRSTPGNIRLTSFPDRRDWTIFHDAYTDPESGIGTGKNATAFPTTTGPITYTGHDAAATDAANLKHAVEAAGADNGFITALSPGSAARIANEY